ncbi:MAG: RNA polymerase sigma factor [Saprospiraceae bacterium]|nr:RNA polymerase sigma factor [Saprospiraceae bacterium]
MASLEFSSRLNEMTSALENFAYTLTKDVEEAKDLYQETAFRAIKNWEKFRPETNFKAWLFTIMKNIFINNYRKKVKANTIVDSTDNLHYINSGSTVIVNEGDSNIMMKELMAMMNTLNDSIRLPFLMYYRGYKYQEIAEHFDLPLGTVKSRIFFARKELKDLINKRYHNISLRRTS